jgi:hypothetical protein
MTDESSDVDIPDGDWRRTWWGSRLVGLFIFGMGAGFFWIEPWRQMKAAEAGAKTVRFSEKALSFSVLFGALGFAILLLGERLMKPARSLNQTLKNGPPRTKRLAFAIIMVIVLAVIITSDLWFESRLSALGYHDTDGGPTIGSIVGMLRDLVGK